MATGINLSIVSQSIKTNTQAAIGWTKNHKVIVAGAATTTALAVAAIAGSILTGGIAAIILGAVFGGASIACGALTRIQYHQDTTREKEIAWANHIIELAQTE